jgi:hypothetical protein
MVLSIQPRHAYLYAGVSGRFELSQAKEIFKRILEACVETGLSRALVDGRELTTGAAVMELFELAMFIADQQRQLLASGRLQETRVAYLGAPNSLDPQRFGETVARNRGAILKVSENLEEAMQWLSVGGDDVREESGE